MLSSSRVRNESVVCVQELLLSVLSPGQQVLLDDGKILLDVTEICEHGAKCNVRRGGMLASRKSIALPGVDLQLPTLTDSDRKNLREARAHGVTGVMLPFVRSPKDLQNLRQELEKAFEPQLQVFAKIENIDGVNNLESLLPHADYIVIARGDLGNSMPLWELPGVQADIARRCQRADKPFMVVTQMLASMEKSKVPTRAGDKIPLSDNATCCKVFRNVRIPICRWHRREGLTRLMKRECRFPGRLPCRRNFSVLFPTCRQALQAAVRWCKS